MSSFLRFCTVAFLFGAASLGLGFGVFGADAGWQGFFAFGLAFVPMVVTVGLVLLTYPTDPQLQLLVGLGAGGVRMFVVLGIALGLTQTYKEKIGTPFLLWLLVYYLVFLAFEIAFLVARQPPTNESKSP